MVVDYDHAAKNMLAGSMARLSSSAFLYPFDTIKVSLQADRQVVRPRSFLQVGSHMIRDHGISSLYRGYPMRLLYIIPSAAVSFTIYDEVKQRVVHRDGDLSRHPLVPVAVGVALRLIGTCARTPFDLIKQQLQIRGGATVRAVNENVKNGIPFMLRGYTITVLRDGLFSALYFSVYEGAKYAQHIFIPPLPDESGQRPQLRKLREHVVGGALAGAIGSILTAPLDTVKTRLQTQNLVHQELRYRGFLDCVRTMAMQEGVRSFFKGLTPRLIMISCSGAITFTLYEEYKKALGVQDL
ncbi:mitochondrial solute carrier family 25 (mitochondrial aspartate/glutamate transporter) member 12/13 [Andalucia godoyi]|uniref:Mitochondrial solute carrier family 25 (Mitochondrial aspartate/glutamate transporter) member 12/13 n=1 Tax=Andalucia godoyi TaxID=505711 RepID=A0A8K0AI12_ANDGO|nr:mitochondrial solute carrier family 25 (mitochondrial aspartate/glutamate transporter) member 12/13 [Andalucia godoyi]|eukprot:ANDGO_02497.mRNA.1 mitochondrial solute carrier family 25 (mitochondrial aspartate/glutamate transporter) member 12/13